MIVGGGPAGSVAALVLAGRGIAVTVVESRAAPERKVGECVPPSVTPLLRHLGCEDLMERTGHLRSLGNRFVWGSSRPGDRPFLTGAQGDGWHVDRAVLEADLAARAQAAGATWESGRRIVRCERAGDRWRVTCRDSRVLDADIVADATGRTAFVARRLGATRVRYDRLVGACAFLYSATPDTDTYTLVEAVPEGWWYSAVLADGLLAVAFMTDGDLLDRRAWRSLLERTDATWARVRHHSYTVTGAVRVAPADTSRLDTIAGEGWLALGDAAAAYDPLSSYGVGSAMGSGFYGGNAIADLLAGRPEAREAYLTIMQNAYCAFLDQQLDHYARERRWPHAVFWARRRP
ncbi:NAD(P)/FAD-dependent oxidoreductase [Actinomycetospora straminea]|uniref:NAD(P)/FAD-dependent oxidoreductase n=1 Tax=Actinomycetospora straminea TaxID=663607 RepID=UPI0023650BE3|nr:tryptophan 7-halogenase [Actinomycetospora straminea]MDD7933753.1 tryptophan 7-halogenase [Actinomycetospora straminea]